MGILCEFLRSTVRQLSALLMPRLELQLIILMTWIFFILEKLLDTLAEINEKLLKIVKMYFIQNLSTFIYLVTF